MKDKALFILSFRGKPRWFFAGYGAMILECITPVIALTYQKDLINQVFEKGQIQKFLPLLVLFAIFYFSPRLFFTIRKVIFFKIGYTIEANLVAQYFERLYQLKETAFKNNQLGHLLNHVRSDSRVATDILINQLMSEMVYQVLYGLILLVTLARLNWVLLGCILVVSFMYSGFYKRFQPRLKDYQKAIIDHKGMVSNHLEYCVSGIKEITANHEEEWQLSGFKTTYEGYRQSLLTETKHRISLSLMSQPWLYILRLLVIGIGGSAAIKGQLNIGEFAIAYGLVDQYMTTLDKILAQEITSQKFDAAVTSIHKVFEAETEDFGNQDYRGIAKKCTFDKVTFAYEPDKDPILKDLSLDLVLGLKIAFVGKSGCGKSTLLHLLMRHYSPQKGVIRLEGTGINAFNESFNNHIAMVMQTPYFLPESILDNIRCHRDYDFKAIQEMAIDCKCHDFIMALPQGYDTLLGERGVNLSGGQKQRLALLRALLLDPDILILDEATSALDLETQAQVMSMIDKKRHGKTTFVVAHRLSTVINADCICYMKDGQITHMGKHEMLLDTCQEYADLYGLEIKTPYESHVS